MNGGGTIPWGGVESWKPGIYIYIYGNIYIY